MQQTRAGDLSIPGYGAFAGKFDLTQMPAEYVNRPGTATASGSFYALTQFGSQVSTTEHYHKGVHKCRKRPVPTRITTDFLG